MERARLIPGLLCGALALCSCSEPAPSASPPLQPLVYTVRPDLTPEAAAVRERRLMRELLDGASEGNTWGSFARKRRLMPSPETPEALGKLLCEALFSRDEALWEHAFISPRSYIALTHVAEEKGRKRVDEFLGRSTRVWDLFEIERVSEAPEGGLTSVFTFLKLNLGQGRDIRNRRTKDPRSIVQYWGNTLEIGLRGTDVVFTLHIPKIVRAPDLRKQPGGKLLYVVSSRVRAMPKLKTFIETGLHLKPELLRSQDYPFPLAVGNFWRYRRRTLSEEPAEGQRGRGTEPEEPPLPGELDPFALVPQRSSFDADEVLLEITSIERYGTVRLVKLRWLFNDQELTKREGAWVVTPRRVYTCFRACRRHISDLDWLLTHLKRRVPLYQFPLRAGATWSSKRRGRRPAKPVYRLSPVSVDVTVPAGNFPGTLSIYGVSRHEYADPFIRVSLQERSFARGHGIVRRRMTGSAPDGKQITLVEELVESRIMP